MRGQSGFVALALPSTQADPSADVAREIRLSPNDLSIRVSPMFHVERDDYPEPPPPEPDDLAGIAAPFFARALAICLLQAIMSAIAF